MDEGEEIRLRARSNNLPLAVVLTLFAGVWFVFLFESGAPVRTTLGVLVAAPMLAIAVRALRSAVVLGPGSVRVSTQMRTLTIPRAAVTGVSAAVVDRRGYGAVWAPVLELEEGQQVLRMLAGYSPSAADGRAPLAVQRRTAVIADWIAR